MIYYIAMLTILAVVTGFELGLAWTDRDARMLDEEIDKLEKEARKIQRYQEKVQ